MDTIAYLTRYDALLCGDCALNTDDILNEGRNHLLGLTVVPASELWESDCCEECERLLIPRVTVA